MFPLSGVQPVFSLESGRHLYLASASPRRRELLESIALPFSIIRPKDAEPDPLVDEDPLSYAERAASAKGKAAISELAPKENERFLLLAADTIVCIDGEILGKPANPANAFHMLRKLAGRSHKVVSSVHLAWNRGSSLMQCAFTEVTEVSFLPWPDKILKAYAQSEETLDKAGAYAIQGQGAFLAKSINGSWTNVVGLPLSALVKKLLSLGLLLPS